jgi:hypothetical protein
MSFGYLRNTGISWMRDYGDAFHKYQSTTDIRGRIEEPKRPLGQRRSIDSYSIRLKDDGSMGVECVLYRTPVVTFYPTGLVELRCGGWYSISTACFIEEVTNYSARIFNGSLCVSIGGVETRMDSEAPLQIQDGRILNPTTDTTHSLIRGASNKVRKQYVEFLSYASALVRLKSEGFLVAEYEDNFTKAETSSAKNYTDMPEALNRPQYTHFAEDVRKFFALVNSDGEDKHVAHYKAVLVLAHSFGRTTWGQGYKVAGCVINEQMLRKGFEGLMTGYHRDELFVEKERAEGEVKRDPYKKYFEGGWERLHAKQV